jgi:hypothetical protein
MTPSSQGLGPATFPERFSIEVTLDGETAAFGVWMRVKS